MNFLSHFTEHVLSFVYPKICVSCKSEAQIKNSAFCMFCASDIPYSNCFTTQEHDLDLKLLGRVPNMDSAFLFYLYKDGKVQDCIHALKYKGQFNIGVQLGKEFGRKWLAAEKPIPDFIVPVPIHFRKEVKRGYNQSYMFAKGIAEILDCKIDTKTLYKKKANKSQTKKGREERLKNIQESFAIKPNKKLENKRILLVDDVLTTGATLESCGKLISNKLSDKLYIACIAMTKS